MFIDVISRYLNPNKKKYDNMQIRIGFCYQVKALD